MGPRVEPLEPAIADPIRRYIVERLLSGDARGFDDDTELTRSGVLRSLATLELSAWLEKTFAIKLRPSMIKPETFRSVRTIARLVETQRAAGGSGLAAKGGAERP